MVLLSQLNIGQTAGPSGLDLNVEPVWIQNITGSGVVVSVVDDGKISKANAQWSNPLLIIFVLHMQV